MAEKIPILSREAIQELQDFYEWKKQQPQGQRTRPPEQEFIQQAPEVYVVVAPPEGLPPSSGAIVGTGSLTGQPFRTAYGFPFDELGTAQFQPESLVGTLCTVYKLITIGSVNEPILMPAYTSVLVYNLASSAVFGLLLVKRDKFGQWYSEVSQSTPTPNEYALKIVPDKYVFPNCWPYGANPQLGSTSAIWATAIELSGAESTTLTDNLFLGLLDAPISGNQHLLTLGDTASALFTAINPPSPGSGFCCVTDLSFNPGFAIPYLSGATASTGGFWQIPAQDFDTIGGFLSSVSYSPRYNGNYLGVSVMLPIFYACIRDAGGSSGQFLLNPLYFIPIAPSPEVTPYNGLNTYGSGAATSGVQAGGIGTNGTHLYVSTAPNNNPPFTGPTWIRLNGGFPLQYHQDLPGEANLFVQANQGDVIVIFLPFFSIETGLQDQMDLWQPGWVPVSAVDESGGNTITAGQFANVAAANTFTQTNTFVDPTAPPVVIIPGPGTPTPYELEQDGGFSFSLTTP